MAEEGLEASTQPGGVAPQPDGKSDQDQAAKAPSWGPLLIGLLIALVMVTIMATTYISANHGVVAHNLAWGVTGSSPLTTEVQKSVSLDIHEYANQSDLENAANHAEIYGGFVPQTNTLILNVAASLWAPFVMPEAYLKAAKQAGVKLNAKAINTLPPQDPEGVVPGLAVFVLLIGGYLGVDVCDAAHKDGGGPPPRQGAARLLGRGRSRRRSDRRADPRRISRCGEQLLEALAGVRADLFSPSRCLPQRCRASSVRSARW